MTPTVESGNRTRITKQGKKTIFCNHYIKQQAIRNKNVSTFRNDGSDAKKIMQMDGDISTISDYGEITVGKTRLGYIYS